jgi:RNA polymerase sigma factor (sigma-70 family)
VAVLQWTIEDVLSRLPEASLPIIELRIDGYEVAEIAEQLGRSKRTIERILRAFRESLQRALEEE